MKRIVSLTAIMAVAVLTFSGYAVARGGYGGGGRGTGACGNCPNLSASSTVKPVCDGTGPKGMTTQVRPMDGTGSRYGRMGGNAAAATTATTTQTQSTNTSPQPGN